MGYSPTRVRRIRRGANRRGRRLAALTMLSLAVVPAAAAQADSQWSGASTTSSNWSDASNWSGGTAPTPASASTLTFPTLSGCATGSACYTSTNDLTGVVATGLVFGNDAGSYQIHDVNAQDTLAVGSGGISTTAGHGGATTIHPPFTLNASQNWTIGSSTNGYDSLTVLGPVTDTNPADTLSISLTDGDLYADTDIEVGPVTVNGPGTLHIGGASGGGKLNATDGQPIALQGAKMIANPSSSVGQLTTSGGTLLLGTGPSNVGPVTLQVNGPSTIGAAGSPTTFQTLINDNGSIPGTDFSQMTASGDISLAASSLILEQGPGANGQCATLNRGDVATLLTTSGSLSGTFSNAANGAQLQLTGPCAGTPAAKVQINYTANSVTATVVSGSAPTTTTLAAPSPASASTNEKVTLTANVQTNTGGTLAPNGTVAFSANGTPISGCTAQPVNASGSSGSATCTTSFAAADSPVSLTATFNGASGSGQMSSTSAAQMLTVAKGSTATSLTASTNNPAVGQNVTYTATVTPKVSGGTQPSGTVSFADGGNPISTCSARPLSGGTVTCTVSYTASGTHTITASYGGDASFSGSSAPATTVTVTAPPSSPAPPSSSPTPPSSPPPPPPAAHHRAASRLLELRGGLVVFGRTLRLDLKCEGQVMCRGRFTLIAHVRVMKHGHRGTMTLRCASGRFQIRAHHVVMRRVSLSAGCVRWLRHNRHHRLAVVYTSRATTGHLGQRRRIMLALKERKPHRG